MYKIDVVPDVFHRGYRLVRFCAGDVVPDSLQFLQGVLRLHSRVDVLFHFLFTQSDVCILINLGIICEDLGNKLLDLGHILQNKLHSELVLIFETQGHPQLFHTILVLGDVKFVDSFTCFLVRVKCLSIDLPSIPIFVDHGSHFSNLGLNFLLGQEVNNLSKFVNHFLSVTHLIPSPGNQIQVLVILWLQDRAAFGLVRMLQQRKEENAHLPFSRQLLCCADVIVRYCAVVVPVELVEQLAEDREIERRLGRSTRIASY
mmetsp:Transcript_7196/g.12449  ORF Transcript_7196/g.12449 Transcript_7196/m.12449 type:complete len:259 (+) Transcript_7196:1034-1810(+)